jgi:hypothetical protein
VFLLACPLYLCRWRQTFWAGGQALVLVEIASFLALCAVVVGGAVAVLALLVTAAAGEWVGGEFEAALEAAGALSAGCQADPFVARQTVGVFLTRTGCACVMTGTAAKRATGQLVEVVGTLTAIVYLQLGALGTAQAVCGLRPITLEARWITSRHTAIWGRTCQLSICIARETVWARWSHTGLAQLIAHLTSLWLTIEPILTDTRTRRVKHGIYMTAGALSQPTPATSLTALVAHKLHTNPGDKREACVARAFGRSDCVD